MHDANAFQSTQLILDMEGWWVSLTSRDIVNEIWGYVKPREWGNEVWSMFLSNFRSLHAVLSRPDIYLCVDHRYLLAFSWNNVLFNQKQIFNNQIMQALISMTGLSLWLFGVRFFWCPAKTHGDELQTTVTLSFVTLHNVHFGYYVYLPTEQAETYLKRCALINCSTYICLCLFGWKVSMIFKETVTFKL